VEMLSEEYSGKENTSNVINFCHFKDNEIKCD